MRKDESQCIKTDAILDWVQLPFSLDYVTCFHKQNKRSFSTKINGVYELNGDTTELLWECPDKLKIAGTLTIHCTENTDSISIITNDKPSFSITGNNVSRSFTSSPLKKLEMKGFTPSTFSSGKYDITIHIQPSSAQPASSPCYLSDHIGNPTALSCQATLPPNRGHRNKTEKASILIRGFVTVSIQKGYPFTFPVHYRTFVNMYAPKDAVIHAKLSSIHVTPTIIPSSPEEKLSYLYVNVSGKIDVETHKKTIISLKGIHPPRN